MLISIIVPIYNVESYIKDCILSVLNQTYDNIEVIAVDDCTPDNSIDVLGQAVLGHINAAKVRIVRHRSNLGLSEARNTGIKAATGEYVFFLDSDDELPLDAIENLVNVAYKYNADFVTGKTKVLGSKTIQSWFYMNPSLSYIPNNDTVFSSLLEGKWQRVAWNKLVKLSLFKEGNIWFEPKLLHEDELWGFQLALNAKSMAFCHCDTYLYKIRESSITSTLGIKHIESYLMIAKKVTQLAVQYNRISIDVYTYIYYFRKEIFNHILNIQDSNIKYKLWVRAFREAKTLLYISYLSPEYMRLWKKFRRKMISRTITKMPIKLSWYLLFK